MDDSVPELFPSSTFRSTYPRNLDQWPFWPLLPRRGSTMGRDTVASGLCVSSVPPAKNEVVPKKLEPRPLEYDVVSTLRHIPQDVNP
jgi:hypothetical protein